MKFFSEVKRNPEEGQSEVDRKHIFKDAAVLVEEGKKKKRAMTKKGVVSLLLVCV